jgi:aerobic-type carbon monoxide dehydrogenase small subunit (CoxS/CutS family)
MATFTLHINGNTHSIEGTPGDNLLTVLRYELGLTGSKYGCGEGQCGACTVLVDGVATRSCVTKLETLEGKRITTIEALAPAGRLHPVQEAFLEAEAFQCGYCTPGMVMAVASLLNATPSPTEREIATALDRNICRCGTFPRIVKAVQLASQRMKSTTAAGGRR